MGKSEIPELVNALIAELKKQGMSTSMCSAGLSDDQVNKVDGWTKDDGFTDDQMEGLKNFADAMKKTKKYIGIGLGIIVILTLKEYWILLLKWLKESLIN